MPRAIWKGSISFGLVNVPVGLYSAEEPGGGLSFTLHDSRDMARVRSKRVNEQSGEEVPWEEIVKAYELDDGRIVPVAEEDFEKADVEATQTIDILDFVQLEEINHAYFDKPYYLAPEKQGDKGYVLLRKTMDETGLVGIAQVVIRTRQRLCALIPEGDVLVLEILRYAHELRNPESLDLPSGDLRDFKISKKELDMARQLVESMETEWDPTQYRDVYTERMLDWIERKAEQGEAVEVPEAAEVEEAGRGKVVDIMDQLKKSLE
jgi:DNA end-binding protein Ku